MIKVNRLLTALRSDGVSVYFLVLWTILQCLPEERFR